jgi:hypothetical protein
MNKATTSTQEKQQHKQTKNNTFKIKKVQLFFVSDSLTINNYTSLQLNNNL